MIIYIIFIVSIILGTSIEYISPITYNVQYKDNDLVYGQIKRRFNSYIFIQNKWVTFNKPLKEGIARGEIGQFSHITKIITKKQTKQYIKIDQSRYEELVYKDYSKI